MNKIEIKILLILVSLVYILRVIRFIPDSLFLYYSTFLIISGTILLISKYIQIKFGFLFLIVSGLISIGFNDVPSFFSPYSRLISFTIILVLCSPLFNSLFLDLFRLALFKATITFITLTVLISFALMITNIIPLSFPYGGITVHSMILGPLASISMLNAINNILFKKQSILFSYTITGISLMMVLVASSRGAVLSLFISLFFLLFKFNRYRRLKSITSILAVLLAIGITYPVWKNYFVGLEAKMENNLERGSTYSSRDEIWKDRIEEFKSSPVFGVGFSSLSRENIVTKEKSQVELGSSYLGILSMTGLLGFISFLIAVIPIFLHLITTNNNNTFALSSILVFLLIHMAFEGYIFGSGNSLMFLFWLILGTSSIFIRFKKNEERLQKLLIRL